MINKKITQYGLSKRAGGWDPDGDSGTDNWQGDAGNTLNFSSCALTQAARTALAILPKEIVLVKITTSDPRVVLYRTTDDCAPEAEERLDLFMPWAFDSHLPDLADVEVIR